MSGVLFVVLLFFLKCCHADNKTYSVMPEKTAEFCKEHICREGYIYRPFYRIDDTYMKRIKKDSEVTFEMHLGIQGPSNGHILLSPVEKPGYNDPVYEIVVGGGGNKFTELRRNLKRNAKASVKTADILNAFELRAFYLRITEDGIIEFNAEGRSLPVLSYFDVDPLEIKYFSFAAWPGVDVKFLYDCPIANSTNNEPDSQEVERPVPPSDQLKMTMLKYRFPWVSPNPIMNVSLGIKVTNVKYNVFTTKLQTDVAVVITWKDETMAWNPDKFNNTKVLKLRQGQIWHPKFHVYNSDQMQPLDASSSEVILMSYTGEATFHFQAVLNTWCADFETAYKWPRDEYSCSIVIQPWEAHEKIAIERIFDDDERMAYFSDIDLAVQNEWDVSLRAIIIEPSTWSEVYYSNDDETHQSDRFLIHATLKRLAMPFNVAFYTPLIALLVFILMSFWTEPLTVERVWFYTGCIVIMAMGLCSIDTLIPSHTVPSILVFYITVIGAVLAALLIQVLLMTSIAQRVCNTVYLQRILGSFYLRQIFCLPDSKPSSNGDYSPQEDHDYECVNPRDSIVEEMESDKHEVRSNQKDVAEILDRVLFFSYSITFGVMLAEHF